MTTTKTASRRRVAPEPIHAELAPVRAYVEHISALKRSPFHVVTIPEGTAAHGMGYRFTSIPGDELAYYLANGATEA